MLTLFLLNPDKEYFVRELTRELDEQINSIRRELENLKKIGLLRSRVRARKKYYTVNKKHILYHDLRNIIIKITNSSENLIKSISKMGRIDFLLISGVFIQKDSPVDILIAGDVDKAKLESFLDKLESKDSIRFSALTTEDFIYRLKCRYQFILDLIQDPDSIIGVNKIESHL
jgi:DNA-binding transcriptional ArsR family regulator